MQGTQLPGQRRWVNEGDRCYLEGTQWFRGASCPVPFPRVSSPERLTSACPQQHNGSDQPVEGLIEQTPVRSHRVGPGCPSSGR